MGKIESIGFKKDKDGVPRVVVSGFCDCCYDEFEPQEVKSFKWLDDEFLCPRCYKEGVGEKLLDNSDKQTLTELMEKYASYSEDEFYHEWFSHVCRGTQTEILKEAFKSEAYSEESEELLREFLKQDTDFLKEIAETEKGKEIQNG